MLGSFGTHLAFGGGQHAGLQVVHAALTGADPDVLLLPTVELNCSTSWLGAFAGIAIEESPIDRRMVEKRWLGCREKPHECRRHMHYKEIDLAECDSFDYPIFPFRNGSRKKWRVPFLEMIPDKNIGNTFRGGGY